MIANTRLDLSLEEMCAALTARPQQRVRSAITSGQAGRRIVSPVSRARDGLRWVLARHGVGPGDEVLVPDLVCETVGEAIQMTGARTVTYGLVPGTLRPSVELCERAISSATKAVIVAHLFGMRADIAAFAAVADRHGLLLVEDSALLLPSTPSGLEDYESPAPCVLYSFNYGKPLSLGWGGAVSLAPSLAARVGSPLGAPMDAEDDRFYAAALLVGHAVTGAARFGARPVRADAGLHVLSARGGARRLAVPDWGAVEAVLEAAASGPEALLAWCETRLARGRDLPGAPVSARTSRPIRWAAATATRLGSAFRAVAWQELEPLELLLPGGYAERLLDLQRRHLEEGNRSEARRAVAAAYACGLDPNRWLFPEAGDAAHWLSFPVAARAAGAHNRAARDRAVRRIARRLGIDIHPYVWPDVLHRVAHLRRCTTPGPGHVESEQLVDRLLNLPVHNEVSLAQAEALVEALNSSW